MSDEPYGLPDEWEEDFYDEEELIGSSCNDCGPWCPDWGGDGLCMVAIRAQVDEGEHEESIAWDIKWRWIMFWTTISDWLQWNVGPCRTCGKFYLFGKNDHSDCLPF